MKRALAIVLCVGIVATLAVAVEGSWGGGRFTFAIDPALDPRTPPLPPLDVHPGTRTVGAVAGPSGIPDEFVLTEIVVRSDDRPSVDALAHRYGGVVLRDGISPLLPEAPHPEGDAATAAGWYLVSIDPERSSPHDLARNMQKRGLTGQFRFSSEGAARLMAVVARETNTSPNFVLQAMQCSVCEHPIAAGGNVDAASPAFFWMTEDDNPATPGDQGLSVGVVRAWAYLQYMGFPPAEGTWRPVILAVIDTGFDLDPATGVPNGGNRDYRFLGAKPMQIDLVDHDGMAGGPNMGGGDMWHGQGTFGVCCAYPRNGYGTAGTGGEVVRPLLIRTDVTSFLIGDALRAAYLNGASVINMSFGGDCGDVCRRWVNETQGGYVQQQIAYVTSGGAIVVSASGNDNKQVVDFDACRYNGVLCVGAIDASGQREPYSNFGEAVDIWGPDCTFSTPGPGTYGLDGLNALPMFCGTSGASPLVAGIVALMKQLNPSLQEPTVRQILRDTANASTDPLVTPGYVDAFRAVGRVGPNLPPTVAITQPVNGATVGRGALPNLIASVDDPEPGFVFVPTSLVWTDGTGRSLCSGNDCTPTGLGIGRQSLTATYIDQFGASASNSVQITVVNNAPEARIDYPPSGARFSESQLINLRGSSYDMDEAIAAPNLLWSSDVAGTLGTGASIWVSLSPGRHQITLKASDAMGASGQASVSIDVTPGTGVPTARILSPADQQSFGLDDGRADRGTVTLRGEGIDPEQGALPDSDLEWRSNVDGVLGHGQRLNVFLSGSRCAPFPHTITLTVRDASGNTSTHEVVIYVGSTC